MFVKEGKKYTFLKISVLVVFVILGILSFIEPTKKVEHIEKSVVLSHAQ